MVNMENVAPRPSQAMGPFAERIRSNNDDLLSKGPTSGRREEPSKSTHPDKLVKQFFDCLSKFLPLSLLALIVTVVVYAISFFMDKETIQSISKIIGIILLIFVIPSALLFWAKTLCSRPDSCCGSDDHDSVYMIPI